MRAVGMTLAGLALAAAAAAQPPGQNQPDPAAEAARRAEAAKRLDAHLIEWQQRMAQLNNFRADFALERTEPVFKRKAEYAGAVLCMKPNLARLRLESRANKADYEAYICNGQAVYQYDGKSRTITEFKVAPNPADGGGNLMLDFLSGIKAADAKTRFQMTLFQEDANYIYLDILPVLGKDKQEFVRVRFALFGPGVQVDGRRVDYLPAQVYLAKPDGGTELWTFSKQEVNLPGVGPENFRYEEVKGYTFKPAPATAGPAAPPAGGARPPQPQPGGPPRP